MLKVFSNIFILALVLVANAFSLSTYTASVSAQSSVTIANSQHGFGTDKIAAHVYNTLGDRLPDAVFVKSVDASTFSVTLTFASPFTGTVKLTGPFSEAGVTNAQRDFDAALTAGEKSVKICSSCSPVNPAFAGAGVKKFYSGGSIKYFAPAAVASSVFVYIDGGKVVFQVGSSAEAGAITEGPGEVRIGGSGFPAGVEKLFELAFTSQPNSSPTIVDKRGWL